MKVNENKKKSGWVLKLLLCINILSSLLLIGAYLATHFSPNAFSLLPFLGLSYPLWLLSALFFLVLWFFVKPKWMLVSALTILLGINHLRHFVAVTLSQPVLQNSVKVVSYNVKIFNLYDLENRIEKRNGIFNFLKAESPDIMCFQEFYHHEGGKKFVTKDSMVQLLGIDHYHERYTHDMTDKRYFGVATFSKFPIVNRGEIPFENDANNFCIYTDLLVNADTLRVYNAHIGSIRFQEEDYAFFDQTVISAEESEERIYNKLKSAFKKRATQSEQVAAHIQKSPYPVVVCGDLNDTPVSYCYRQFIRLLNDAFVESGNGFGYTYIGLMPSNRIDYIFHSPSIMSSNFTTHDIDFSDHRPISCWIEMPK